MIDLNNYHTKKIGFKFIARTINFPVSAEEKLADVS